MEAEKQERQYTYKNQAQSAIQIQSPRQRKQQVFQMNTVKSIVVQPKKQLIPQQQSTKPKNKNLQIPLYRAKNQTNENKLDRISKYIASLKRNMKLNSQTLGYKWKIKQFLLQDSNYLELRNELEKYMMREEQIDNLLSKAIEKGIKDYVRKAEIVESTGQYKLIKIYKNNKKQGGNLGNKSNQKETELKIQQKQVNSKNNAEQINFNQFSHKQTPDTTFNFSLQQKSLLNTNKSFQQPKQTFLSSYNSPKATKQPQISQKKPQQTQKIFTSPFSRQNRFTSPLKKLSKIQIQQKAQQDFKSIKKQLQKSNQNYIEIMSKINETVEKGSQKLIQLREKRKKKFQKDDNIWDELDKI